MSNKIVPRQGSTLSFWRTNLHDLDSHRTTAELPAESDILIIGAGYSGASVAYHLLDGNHSPVSIVILEARGACSGATGRNGGHLKPDVYFGISKYAKQHGLELAAEVARFEMSHVPAIKEVVEKERIDCDFVLTRTMDVFLDAAQAGEAREAYEELASTGVDFVKDVQFTDDKDAELVSGVKSAKACASYTAAHLWPYKFITHLLTTSVARGVNLQTYTPVLSVSSTCNSAGYWTATTARGIVRARKIVYACNGYTAGLLPEYAEKIVPCRGICSRITVPAGITPPYLSNTYVLRRGHGVYDYLIRRPDGSIVVGGARQKYMTDMEQWYGNVDDGSLIGPASDYFDGYMQRNFLGWEGSGAFTDKVWTGVMGYTSDSMPHVGEVPGKPGQLILAGYNGHGMPVVFLSAKGIAKMVRDDKPFEEIGVPKLYKTSKERLERKSNDILSLVPRL